jgi:bacterioferritin
LREKKVFAFVPLRRFPDKLCGPTQEDRMKGDDKVIQHLNKILANELTAINQYFLHAKMLRNWGLGKLADHEYKESIDEMKHADRLMERILFLEGMPAIQLKKVQVGRTVNDVLGCDLKLEMAGHPELKEAIAYCEKSGDFVSRELFESIIGSEEEHIDWLETQLALIDKVGLQNYLQSGMS